MAVHSVERTQEKAELPLINHQVSHWSHLFDTPKEQQSTTVC